MKNQKSIRKELLITMGLIAVTMAVVVSMLFFFELYKDIAPNIDSMAKEVLTSKSAYLGDWIKEKTNTIQGIANSEMAKQGKWDSVSEELTQIYNSNREDYLNLFYATKSGKGWSTEGKTIDASYEDYFKSLISSKQNTITTDAITLKNKKTVFIVASIVKNPYGEAIGIIGGSILLNKLEEISTKMNIKGHGYGWIINDHGLVIAHPNSAYTMNFNILKDSEKYGYKNLEKVFNNKNPNTVNIGTIIDPNNKKKIVFFTKIPYSNDWYLGISVLKSQLYSSVNNLLRIIIVSMVFLVLSLILIALFISDKISKPLKDLSWKIKKIEDGDLNVSFKKSEDNEIGIIQTALKNLQESLDDILRNIRDSSNRISSIVTELAEYNEDFSKRVLSDSTKIEQISATTEELTASFDLTAENASGSIDIAQKTIDITKENEQNILMVVESAERLSEISSKISEIMNFVNKVAFQTNLLAVNASVEAARFGREGSGFAVVASEIRNLSRKISEYSLEIGKLLASNQMIVNDVSKSTENAKDSFKLMEGYITELVEKSNNISSSVVEQNDAIKQIADAIIDMSGSMQSNVEVMREISKITLTLSEEAENLDSITSQYKLKREKENDK